MSRIRFKELSDQDKSYIKAVHADSSLGWDERMSMLMNRFSISERTVRRWIKRLGFSNYAEIESEEVRQGKLRNYDTNAKYYIITWAQNATPVHLSFWKNILKYAEYLKAEIGVIQGRYQNPTSLWTKNMESDEWWDDSFTVYEKLDGQQVYTDGIERITQEYYDKMHWDEKRFWKKAIDFSYLDGGRHTLHPGLDLLSDIKIRPTAVNPLTGFEGLSGDRSSILGHPRVHLRSLPVLKGHPSKLLLTTGACTIRNYTDTKAGKKAEFHHTYGFVIVEIKDEYTYYLRQVTAKDDGSFIDLMNKVEDGKVSKIKTCPAYVFGDIHAYNVDEKAMDVTFNKLFDQIKPRRIILHDIFDGQSVNHHEAKNPIKAYARYKKGVDIVEKEVEHLFNLIEKYEMLDYNPIVVRSNHDIWLEKWIQEKDWKKDIRNAETYMQYALALLKGDAKKGLLPYLIEQKYGDAITTLGLDDSYKILGWEIAQHGHLGSHGSKGNLEQYRKLNTKVVVGDYHQPGRKDGAVGVGTYSKLRMGYNTGASAWMHSGAIIHENGKVQHIILMEDNDFTTLI